jgi:hypothetical protein
MNFQLLSFPPTLFAVELNRLLNSHFDGKVQAGHPATRSGSSDHDR